MRTGHEPDAEADRLPAAATCGDGIGRAGRAEVPAAPAHALLTVAAALLDPSAAMTGASA